jgi:uncharacterized membrane protein YphA (DoxX/SURF4 family)
MPDTNLHLTLAAFLPGLLVFEFSRTAFSMSVAGIVLFLVGVLATKSDFASARGLDKIVALSNLCFALPLAVFGAEHISAARGIMFGVPAYMPWRLFWAYFVGFALVAASLSIVTKIEIRWSALLFGIMLLLFEAMLHIPRAHANPSDRFAWTIVFREFSFTGGAWALAGHAMYPDGRGKTPLVITGRLLIGVAAIFFGVEHFLHPTGVPVVPLEKLMPAWVPAGVFIDYLTGAILVVAGVSFLIGHKTRTVATYLGSWILLLVILVYGPILVISQLDPGTAVKVEGLNYFADTLLFAGAVLALASASPRSD